VVVVVVVVVTSYHDKWSLSSLLTNSSYGMFYVASQSLQAPSSSYLLLRVFLFQQIFISNQSNQTTEYFWKMAICFLLFVSKQIQKRKSTSITYTTTTPGFCFA
jgi:hypothetical protein